MQMLLDTPAMTALSALVRSQEAVQVRDKAAQDAVNEILPDDFPKIGDAITFTRGKGKKAKNIVGEVVSFKYSFPLDKDETIQIDGFTVFVDGEGVGDIELSQYVADEPQDTVEDIEAEFEDAEEDT